MIMKVACFFSQHSPILGQPASSQTVTRPFSRMILWVSLKPAETGALTRIQSGFLQQRGIRPMRLFRVARARIVDQVEDDGHGPYLRLRALRRKAALRLR